jgi:hypothetical protein
MTQKRGMDLRGTIPLEVLPLFNNVIQWRLGHFVIVKRCQVEKTLEVFSICPITEK